MVPASLHVRAAVADDAPALYVAERDTSTTPGLLVSQPHELSAAAFREKISWLSQAGLYLVATADTDADPLAHACLEPLPLQSRAHVFSLTIVVHPGHRDGVDARLAELGRTTAAT